MVMVMVATGALASTHFVLETYFVLLKNLTPEGPVAVERKVGNGHWYSFYC